MSASRHSVPIRVSKIYSAYGRALFSPLRHRVAPYVGHGGLNGASATNKFTANLLVTSPPDRLSGHVRSRRLSSLGLDGGLNILHLMHKGPAGAPFFSAERFYQGLRKRNDSATCRDGSAVAR